MGVHLRAAEDPLKQPKSDMVLSASNNGPPVPNMPKVVPPNGDAAAMPLQALGSEREAAAMEIDEATRYRQADDGATEKDLAVEHPGPSDMTPLGSSAIGVGEQGEVAEAPAPPAQLPELPDKVEVVCGTARGVLDLKRLRVLYNGEDISATQFEKAGGRALSKKWKASIRVVENGRDERCVDSWLKSKGWLIKHVSIIPLGASAQQHEAARQRRRTAVTELQRAALVATDFDQPPLWKLISLASDPTMGRLPEQLPAHVEVSSSDRPVTPYNLNEMSTEDLLALSVASCEAPLADLLEEQPGVFPNNQAFLTGHKPVRVQVVGKEDAAVQLAQYLRGELAELPWSSLGINRAPTVAGQYVELRMLYNAVQQNGGFDEVNRLKLWDKIVVAIGFATLKTAKQTVKIVFEEALQTVSAAA
eukprot:jgi/Botrbrau1/7068/Bobra.0165s0091.1